ncbi:hypothetical protein HanPSC8_Chr03g0130841 [Helianthus annuus]|nr:hypothetical protein HanPSC8_Chr03g0130841 [Helianthus annuus]
MYLPTIVFIKVLECSVEMFFSIHSIHMHCCGYELFVVYGSIPVCIRLFYLPSIV